MKSRYMSAAAAALLIAGTALGALSPEFADFGKSAAAKHLMTREEAKQWKAVKTDEEAKKFIDVFWARRDPTPATPENEFKAQYDEAVRQADASLSAPRFPGAVSDRGKVLILFGGPTKRSRAPRLSDDRPATETWVYEGDSVPEYLGVKELWFVFEDRENDGEYRLGVSPKTRVAEVIDKAVKHAMVSPNLTEVPTYTAAAKPAPAPVAQAPAAPAAAPPADALKTDALRVAANQVRTAEKNPFTAAYITYDEFITPQGQHFVPVQIFVPGTAGVAEGEAVFFGTVTDEAGTVVASYEENVTLSKTKNDVFFDKSLTLAPGKYVGVFGLARNGQPVAAARQNLEIKGLDKTSPGTSRLILTNDIFALTTPQKYTDPYAFGGIRVIPRGNQTFTTADEMWYFLELRNPGIDPATSAPSMQVKLDIEGQAGEKKVKMGLPLQEVDVQPLKGVDGHYAIGTSIPLTDFKPGKYTLKVKLIDTVSKTNSTLEQSFTVVGAQ